MIRRNNFYAVMLTGAAMLMAACSASEVPNVTEITLGYDPSVIRLTMHLEQRDATRAATNLQDETLSFTTAGVYVYKTGETTSSSATATVSAYTGYANKKVTGRNSQTGLLTLEDNEVMYFPMDKSAVDAYVYAPYQADNTAPLTAVPFSVSTNQSGDSDYLLSDLVWGKGTATFGNAASLSLRHALSKVTLSVKAGSGWDTDKIQGLKMTGVSTTGTLNMSTGVVTTTSGSNEVIFSNSSTTPASAILPPQEKDVTLVLTYNDASYTATIPKASFKLESGKSYNYLMTVNATALTVELSTINPWTSGGGTSVKATNPT